MNLNMDSLKIRGYKVMGLQHLDSVLEKYRNEYYVPIHFILRKYVLTHADVVKEIEKAFHRTKRPVKVVIESCHFTNETFLTLMFSIARSSTVDLTLKDHEIMDHASSYSLKDNFDKVISTRNSIENLSVDFSPLLASSYLGIFKRLTKINMEYVSEIHSIHFSMLVSSIVNYRTVKHMSLKGCFLPKESEKELSKLVSAESSICSLDISSCKITNVYALEIAKNLSNSVHLQHLCIQSNDIEEKGMQALVKGASLSKTLRRLNLSYNSGLKHCLKDIHEMCITSASLTYLNISNESFSWKELSDISSEFKKYRSLRKLIFNTETPSLPDYIRADLLNSRWLNFGGDPEPLYDFEVENKRLRLSTLCELVVDVIVKREIDVKDIPPVIRETYGLYISPSERYDP